VKQNLTMKQTKSSNGAILKQVQNDRGKCIGHPEEGEQRMKAKAHLFNASRTEGSLTNPAKDSSRVSHVQNDRGCKILKQMTPEQKVANGCKYMNTSFTAKSGILRQY
ncbi:hypothetical protein IJ472_04150, partial [bacterium]|nr:hypothetical protein [bacterium]